MEHTWMNVFVLLLINLRWAIKQIYLQFINEVGDRVGGFSRCVHFITCRFINDVISWYHELVQICKILNKCGRNKITIANIKWI